MSSIPSITDVTSQVSQIEAQLESLTSGAMLDSLLGISSSSTSSADSTGSTSSTGFADALSAVEGTDDSSVDDDPTATSTGLGTTATTTSTDSGGVGLSTGVTLPASSAKLLTSDQRQFASTLSAQTGLNPAVVCSWLLAEESSSAAQSRQAANNNDWLNIGYTGSGTYGAGDSVWSNPVTAAKATAEWIKGEDSIPGYGTASSGIQAILKTVGETPATQISALQNSGWAGSGYTDLGELYAEVTGS